mmetsp:Transcript_12541/g.18488  ORF Transcript_12541/g.18488 Transcript_12541/m.18488 type:complete len:378 (-) Transcript_12541:243-1376(-)
MADDNQNKRMPEDTPFKQQRMKAWQPILIPKIVISILLTIAIIFIIIGAILYASSKNVVEMTMKYDGKKDVDVPSCQINQNALNTTCTIGFNITDDMDAPIYVYYELNNFYQNHRRYVKSRSEYQLMGEIESTSDLEEECDPLTYYNDLVLSPCGLIANSFFNDVFEVSAGPDFTGDSLAYMDETGIAWKTDVEDKFAQPDGFVYEKVDGQEGDPDLPSCDEVLGQDDVDCKEYTDPDGQLWYYWYPNDDTTQYLYESYPGIISPLEGVKNEHFIVWMRTAGLPSFRKLYGIIDTNLKAGDYLEFTVQSNFPVTSFNGAKSLVISTTSWFGGKNSFLGIAYLVVGCICLALGLVFAFKERIDPRQLGDPKYLQWKEE